MPGTVVSLFREFQEGEQSCCDSSQKGCTVSCHFGLWSQTGSQWKHELHHRGPVRLAQTETERQSETCCYCFAGSSFFFIFNGSYDSLIMVRLCVNKHPVSWDLFQFQTQIHSTSERITTSGRSLKQALSIKSHCCNKTKQEQHRILID